MTSKNYIKDIQMFINEAYSDKEPLQENQIKSKRVFNDYCNEIKQDLDRLEEVEKENKELKNKNTALELWNDCYTKENAKLKKTIEILKNKKVNIFHIWVFDDYEQYKAHYPFSEYNAREDMLTFEEFDLLKEVLE